MSEHKHENDYGPKEIAEILDAVSDKIPGMVKGLFNAIYSAEAGAEAGKSVGNFYTNLLESGIPEDLALKLTERYMFSIRDVVEAAKANNYDEE
jgi:hypothetical protein